jgi:hypothetical protein
MSGSSGLEGSGCDCLLMQAASLFDGFSFDLFPPLENGLTAPEVDVSWRHQVVCPPWGTCYSEPNICSSKPIGVAQAGQ